MVVAQRTFHGAHHAGKFSVDGLIQCFDALNQLVGGLEVCEDADHAGQRRQPRNTQRNEGKAQNHKQQALGDQAGRVFLRGDRDAQTGKIRLIALPLVLAHGHELRNEVGHRPQRFGGLFLKRRLAVGIADQAADVLSGKIQEVADNPVQADGDQQDNTNSQNKAHLVLSSSSTEFARDTHTEVISTVASTTASVILPGMVSMSMEYQSGIMKPMSGMLPSTRSTVTT